MVPQFRRPIRILMVEDNRGDVRLVEESLREGQVPYQLAAVPDGEAALRYLRREGDYAGSDRPDLILLDLNLPRTDGREVLAEIKRDPALKRIPVVVLTSSKAEQDIVRSYDLHANCYVVKPVDLEQFFSVVRALRAFWCDIVELPEG